MLSSLVSPAEQLLAVRFLKTRRKRARERDHRLAAAEGVQTLAPEEPLRFRGASLAAQEIIEPEFLLAGPSETSKTTAGLWRLDAEARKYPDSRWAIVRKVRADMDTTVLETWRAVLSRKGGDVTHTGGRHPDAFVYPNGAEVYVGGMDRPGKVLSGERDGIYVCQAEEFALADWETLTTRVTGRGAKTTTPMLFGDCNPGPSSHWILGRQRLKILHSRHTDNPFLFDDDGNPMPQWTLRTQPTLEALTGVRRERLYHGRWVAAEGVVYEEFDRGLHVIPRFEIPDSWRRIAAVDFGYTHPFVWQLWAIDGDGRMYLEHEIYRSRRIVSDHADQILQILGDRRVDVTVADHDAEDRATLAAKGIPTTAAAKSVSPGIQAVARRLRKAGDGRPRLFLFEDALTDRDMELERSHRPACTASEFEVYSWPMAADGKASKEAPVKEFDDGLDALRYAVANLDGLGNDDASTWLAIARQSKERREAAKTAAA